MITGGARSSFGTKLLSKIEQSGGWGTRKTKQIGIVKDNLELIAAKSSDKSRVHLLNS